MRFLSKASICFVAAVLLSTGVVGQASSDSAQPSSSEGNATPTSSSGSVASSGTSLAPSSTPGPSGNSTIIPPSSNSTQTNSTAGAGTRITITSPTKPWPINKILLAVGDDVQFNWTLTGTTGNPQNITLVLQMPTSFKYPVATVPGDARTYTWKTSEWPQTGAPLQESNSYTMIFTPNSASGNITNTFSTPFQFSMYIRQGYIATPSTSLNDGTLTHPTVSSFITVFLTSSLLWGLVNM